ncbi:MAG: hypothetical protein KF878_17765 [Planctomycetes bacterium]|nr:hypothetical protein [Planctomycetota bacterium]
MPHTIEEAKSGRAACRTCKEKIEKGVLRFGEEVPNQFAEGPSYQWHHLACAAKKKPAQLEQALGAFAGDVPDRAALEQAIAEHKGKARATTLPYAEKAPTGHSRCMVCEEPIAKGELRVAVEREVDTGSFVSRGAGYLHPACAKEHAEADPDLLEKVRQNSVSLAPADLEAVAAALDGE